MDYDVPSPIRPGTRHMFQLSTTLMESQRSINYRAGDQLLLHLSIREQGRLVVLNKRQGPSWGKEIRLPRAQGKKGPLHIDVAFSTLEASVSLDGLTPTLFKSSVDFGEVDRIEFVRGTNISITPAPEPVLRTGSVRAGGVIDRASAWLVRGWAFDPQRPEAHLTIEFFLNGTPAGYAAAERDRPDLETLHPRLRQCGFLFRPPKKMLGQSGKLELTARIAGTQQELLGSPWLLRRPLTPADSAKG